MLRQSELNVRGVMPIQRACLGAWFDIQRRVPDCVRIFQSEIISQTTVFSLQSRCWRDDKLKAICMQDVFSLIAAWRLPRSLVRSDPPGGDCAARHSGFASCACCATGRRLLDVGLNLSKISAIRFTSASAPSRRITIYNVPVLLRPAWRMGEAHIKSFDATRWPRACL